MTQRRRVLLLLASVSYITRAVRRTMKAFRRPFHPIPSHCAAEISDGAGQPVARRLMSCCVVRGTVSWNCSSKTMGRDARSMPKKVWARASCVCSLNSLGLRLDARQQILDVECRWLSLSTELVNAPKAASPSLATPWASIRGEIIETGLADRLRVPWLLPGGLSAIAHARKQMRAYRISRCDGEIARWHGRLKPPHGDD